MCEKCQDRGFIEHNAGLLIEVCDCEAGKEYKAKMVAIAGIPEEVADDSDSGTEPDNSNTRSGDTSEPSKPKQQKKRKKARKRAK